MRRYSGQRGGAQAAARHRMPDRALQQRYTVALPLRPTPYNYDMAPIPNSHTRRTVALAAVGCAVLLAGCGSSSTNHAGSASTGVSQAVTYANCVRAHGVPNFPDLGTTASYHFLAQINPSAPAFEAAQKACAKHGNALAPRPLPGVHDPGARQALPLHPRPRRPELPRPSQHRRSELPAVRTQWDRPAVASVQARGGCVRGPRTLGFLSKRTPPITNLNAALDGPPPSTERVAEAFLSSYHAPYVLWKLVTDSDDRRALPRQPTGAARRGAQCRRRSPASDEGSASEVRHDLRRGVARHGRPPAMIGPRLLRVGPHVNRRLHERAVVQRADLDQREPRIGV
jgi:hypothetical protein